MPLRLDVEPGGEYLLPYAKSKLADLKRNALGRGIHGSSKVIQVDTGASIFLQTISVDRPVVFDYIRITAASGWNAYRTAGATPLHTYYIGNKGKVLVTPDTVFLETSGPHYFFGGNGALFYPAFDLSTAYYVYGTIVQEMIAYSQSDVDKTTPLFPATGVTLNSYGSVCGTATGLFQSAAFDFDGQLLVYIINLKNQTVVASATVSVTATIEHFPTMSSTAAWTVIYDDASIIMLSTTGVVHTLTVPAGLSVPDIVDRDVVGIVSGVPVVVCGGFTTPFGSVYALYAINPSGSVLLFSADTFGDSLIALTTAAFTDTSGDYYEVIFLAPSTTVDADPRFRGYSSRTGASSGDNAFFLAGMPSILVSDQNTPTKDKFLFNNTFASGSRPITAYIADNHLYMAMVTRPSSTVLSIVSPITGVSSSTAMASGTTKITMTGVRTNTSGGVVLIEVRPASIDTRARLSFVTTTAATIIDSVSTSYSLSSDQRTGLFVTPRRNEISVFLGWRGTTTANPAPRRLYNLIVPSIIDFGDSGISAPSIPFKSALVTSKGSYCYVFSKTNTTGETLALAAADFQHAGIMDVTGAVKIIETSPVSILGTVLQPPDFESAIQSWNS